MASTSKYSQFVTILEITVWTYGVLGFFDAFKINELVAMEMPECLKTPIPFSVPILFCNVLLIIYSKFPKLPLDCWTKKKEQVGGTLFAINAVTCSVS